MPKVQLALDSKSSMKGQNVASDKISQHLTNFSTDFYAAITSHAPGSAVMNPAKDSAHVCPFNKMLEKITSLYCCRFLKIDCGQKSY